MTKKEYTYEDKLNFIESLYCQARAIAAETGCSWELILAQAALETGWGERVLPGTNNVFNIKADPSWHGPSGIFHVWEKVNNKKIWIDAPFRIYPNVTESLKDRTAFLKNNPRYAKHGLFAPATVGDFEKEATALKEAGYATGETYVEDLIDIRTGPSMRRAVTAAKKEGCAAQLPVIEVLLKDGAKVALANARISVTLGERSYDMVSDGFGAILVRVAPTIKGSAVLKVFDAVVKEWVTLDPVSLPDPFRSLTITLVAPTIRVPTSTRLHDKRPATGATAAPPQVSAAPVGAPHPAAPHRAASLPASSATASSPNTHNIVKGETLCSIASRYKLRYKTIADLNGICSPHIIRPGQVLRLLTADGRGGVQAPPPAPASHAPTAHARARPAVSQAVRVPVTDAQSAVHTRPHPTAPHASTAPALTESAARAALTDVGGSEDSVTAVHVAYYRDDADKPSTVVMASLKAPWMKAAEDEFNARVARVPGKAANPHIVAYLAETHLDKQSAASDETAWCAAFCNWCLVKAGYKGNQSAWAAAFKTWGRPTKDNRAAVGAVAVIRFKNGRHHVTFVAGMDKSGANLATLGGNQGKSSAVTHSHVPTEFVLCYRYPVDYPHYDEDYELHDIKVDGTPLTSATTR